MGARHALAKVVWNNTSKQTPAEPSCEQETTTKNDNNLETFSLLWLDADVNSRKENLDAQQRIRSTINYVRTFDDGVICEQYIQSMPEGDRVVLIVSGRLGREIVPRIHQIQQLSSIYVFCFDTKSHKEWATKFKKVKGVFDEIDDIILQIQFNHAKRTNARIEESFTSAFQGKSSAGIDGNFVHSQIILNVLIRMISSSTDRNELISLCRKQYEGNQHELAILHEFEQNYLADKALWWYSRESFLYRILNKALRLGNIDSLYLFRFFIRDLRMQLERNQCSSRVRVYRGQFMSKDEIEFLRNSIGQLISMSSFLSTSLDRTVVVNFFSAPSDDFESVIFEIDADPCHSVSKPFADITRFSDFKNEGEVLFMLGSIFRIISIDRKDDMWIIQMTLCSDDDDNRSIAYERMNSQYSDKETNLISLANILRDAGRLDEAEKYYHRVLEQLPQDHPDRAACYHGLGDVANEQGDYDKSLGFHKISFEIMAQTLKADDYFLAYSYNSIGNVHAKKGDCHQALEAYKMALKIWKRTLGEDHLDVALCLNNMGAIYERMTEYSNAYKCHQKALAIRMKHLPIYHPHLAQSHNNIGLVHSCRGEFDLAVKHYNQSLAIKSKMLPPKHPDIAMTLYNLGIVYEYKRHLQQAREYYEQAESIYRHVFVSTHSNVVQIQASIRRVSE